MWSSDGLLWKAPVAGEAAEGLVVYVEWPSNPAIEISSIVVPMTRILDQHEVDDLHGYFNLAGRKAVPKDMPYADSTKFMFVNRQVACILCNMGEEVRTTRNGPNAVFQFYVQDQETLMNMVNYWYGQVVERRSLPAPSIGSDERRMYQNHAPEIDIQSEFDSGVQSLTLLGGRGGGDGWRGGPFFWMNALKRIPSCLSHLEKIVFCF